MQKLKQVFFEIYKNYYIYKLKTLSLSTSNNKSINALINKNTTNVSFASLLRYSNLLQLGNPEGKIVTGKIFQVVNNDLYIDFGWKFYCVCSKPVQNNSKFIRGAIVHLQIKDLELSTKFLGSDKDTTISEADCTLLGLLKKPEEI